MNKHTKTTLAIIIGTLLSITLFISVGGAKAEFQRDWTATLGGKNAGTDMYSECDHTDFQYSDDCVADIAIIAQYDPNYPSPYAYNKVQWDFLAQVGWNFQNTYNFYGNPHCLSQIMPVNTYSYQDYHSFDNTNSPSWYYSGCYGLYTKNVWDPSAGWNNFNTPLTSVNGLSSSYFYQINNPSHIIYVAAGPSGSHYQVMTARGTQYTDGESSVEVNSLADVQHTPTLPYQLGSYATISWTCADDWGNYYCYVSSIDLINTGGNLIYQTQYMGPTGSWTLPFAMTNAYHAIIHSTPYTYQVNFNVYVDGNYVNSLTPEYKVAWEERDGPAWSHGSDVHGNPGGGEDYYIADSIDDPWGRGTDYFSYAEADNWGGGSESYYYSIPINVWTFTWGNTVNLYYTWQGYGMNGISPNMPGTDAPTQPVTPTYPANFVPPQAAPYIYNATSNTYIPMRNP